MIQKTGNPGSEILNFKVPAVAEIAPRKELVKAFDCQALAGFGDYTLDGFTNLQRLNDIKGINRYFRQANVKLKDGGVLSGHVETLEQRRKRLFNKFPWGLNLIYYVLDFIFKRVFPKFKYTKKFYFFLTNGRNRALSKSEVLGRLVYCGFKIDTVKEVDGHLHFKAVKWCGPLQEKEPSTGLILRIKRIGHNGKRINVYKFRTMHPYAQYIQDYVFEQNDLKKGGKFADDFRITKWGRWMRRFWIDEIPMVFNILKGDLKLVGVRPLSEHYLSLYTAEHKSLRVTGKPGLIPPFYADMPSNLDEIMESESRYIKAYGQDPITTDFTYCLRAFNNIFLNRARSH
jgi:lipopolysaccharide/colanic/teichoic acid biosynthesis glycosyltransferase